MSEKYEIIKIQLSEESIIRKQDDCLLNKTLLDESIIRTVEDSKIRIKLAEESAIRAEEDSKLSIKISNETAERVHEDTLLKITLDNLQIKMNRIENKKEELIKVERVNMDLLNINNKSIEKIRVTPGAPVTPVAPVASITSNIPVKQINVDSHYNKHFQISNIKYNFAN